jgi:GTPase SAR1 family protein
VVLVGNKCDLQVDRKVTTNEGQALASQWDCPFFETSAALRHFVDDAFHCIIREIRVREQDLAAGSAAAGGVALNSSGRKEKSRMTQGGSGGAGRDLGKMFRKIFH